MWRALVCLVALTSVVSADDLSPDDLARKSEGGYVTGVPLVAYSVDFGDAHFATTPYLFRTFLNVFVRIRPQRRR